MMPMMTVSTGRIFVSGVSRALEPWVIKHEFALAGPHRIDRDHRAAGGHEAVARSSDRADTARPSAA